MDIEFDQETEEVTPQDEITIDPELLSTYYENLKQLNVIATPEDFEFDGTPEKLQEALDKTRQKLEEEASNNLLAQVSPELRTVIEYALSGGQSLQEFLDANVSKSIDQLSTHTVDQQKATLREYYRRTSDYSEDKIDKLISRIDPSDLQTEAEDALIELQSQAEELEKQLLQRTKARRQQEEQQRQQALSQITSQIDTYQTAPERRTKLKGLFLNKLTTQQGVTSEFQHHIGSIMQNPAHLVQLADLLLDYDSKSGFNLERFKKQAQSDAAKNFRTLLQSKTSTTPQQSSQKRKEDFDFSKWISN